MQTHTIRNKRTGTPILTLTPKFWAKAMAGYPEAFTLALSWFKGAYKRCTGKDIRLDYEQELAFMKWVGARPDGTWMSKFSSTTPVLWQVHSMMQTGFRATDSMAFDEALEIAQAFYTMLDHAMAQPQNQEAP